MINENEINYSKSEIKSIKQYEFIFSGKEILNYVNISIINSLKNNKCYKR